MKALKVIIKYVLTTILTALIIIYLFTNLVSSTILNEIYILSKLEHTNYYEKIYKHLEANLENYIYQSGLEKEILDNIVSKEKVESDTKKIISNIYDGLDETIDTQEIENKLKQNIENSIGTSTLNETQKQAIETFIEKICEEYKITISHYQYEKEIHNIYKKIMKNINFIQKILLVVIGIILILLMILNIRKIYKFFSLIGISAVSMGSFFVIVNNYINAKIKVQNIIILNNAVSNTLKEILAEILHKVSNYGIILLISGFLLIVLSNFIHNIRKYEMKKNNKN